MRTARFYNLFVFTTGAAIMMLEFAASRVMAPWFGTSTFVWGNIVGVILIALSLGYYVGGRVADKRPQPQSLAMIVMSAGIITSFLPIVLITFSQTFPYFFAIEGLGFFATIIGSFFTVTILFAIPIFLLGMVSPYAIRIATVKVETAGKVAGGLYAWSTLGSIIGTFASAFWLVPYIGSRETIILSAILLIGIATCLFGKPYWIFAALLLPIGIYAFIFQTPLIASASVIYEEESLYNYLKVQDSDDMLKLIVNEGLGVQSYYMKEGILTGEYYDYIALTPYLRNESTSANVLVLGLAGGSITRQFDHYFPDYTLTGVEIDPAIVDIANTYFHLGEQDITVHVGDARQYIQQSNETYNVIVVDAFANEMYIPWHMTTKEFFHSLNEHLSDDGLVTFNIGSTSTNTNLMQAMIATLQTEFSEVAVTQVPGVYNYIVVASNSPLHPENLATVTDERKTVAEYFIGGYTIQPSSTGMVLTDNRAPVESFTEQMVIEYIREMF